MTNKIVHFKSKIIIFIPIFLLLYFAFLDELADTFLLKFSSINLLHSKFISEKSLAYLLLGLQIVFSPLQAGFSDCKVGGSYLRKKSLIFSLAITFISIILFRMSYLYGSILLCLAVILKGALGNTLPIAWAGISDITPSKNIRFALALSICALAIGSWGPLLMAISISATTFALIVTTLVAIGVCCAIYPLRDLKDTQMTGEESTFSPVEILIQEIKSLRHLVTLGLTNACLLSFLFSEISFYQILFRVEVLNNYVCFIYLPLAIGIGYTLGTAALRFIHWKDKYVSLIGVLISMISIVVILVAFFLEINNGTLFTVCFSWYSFGYAMFTPALFSLITPREHPHLQGKIYGLLESSDSLASLITLILVFEAHNISCSSVLSISTICIFISFLFFVYIFKKSTSLH